MIKVTPEEFVKIWQSSESLSQVCQQTKQTKLNATMLASRYRRIGIKLKRFIKGRPALNIEGLNKIAISSLKKP